MRARETRWLGRGALLASLAVSSCGCGPDIPGGSEGATTGETVTESSTTTGTPTTTASTTTATTTATITTTTMAGGSTSGTSTGDGLTEHGPCPNGNECEACAQSEGASVCGPLCYELGPGFVRCPESPVQEQSICVWGADYTNTMCLIMCGEDSHCPDPGMVCVACPEQYKGDCDNLWVFTEKGRDICAWPVG